MMFWFVNPYKPNLAVNLAAIGSMALKDNMIFLDNQTWVFKDEDQAKRTYEEMIKLVQEFRYRK